jgi:hypothetical protein
MQCKSLSARNICVLVVKRWEGKYGQYVLKLFSSAWLKPLIVVNSITSYVALEVGYSLFPPIRMGIRKYWMLFFLLGICN